MKFSKLGVWSKKTKSPQVILFRNELLKTSMLPGKFRVYHAQKNRLLLFHVSRCKQSPLGKILVVLSLSSEFSLLFTNSCRTRHSALFQKSPDRSASRRLVSIDASRPPFYRGGGLDVFGAHALSAKACSAPSLSRHRSVVGQLHRLCISAPIAPTVNILRF